MMHCEVPKSTSCQQLLTHFSKSEPNGHGPAIQFWRNGKLQMRLNFVLLEEVFKMSSSAFIKGSIPRPFSHQQSGVCPPMQIGLFSKETRGGPPPPPQDTAWDLCSGSFREGSKTGEILLCSEPVNQAPLRPSWRSLSTWPLFPRRLRRGGEGKRGTPADRCFSSHKSPTPRSPSHLWVTEEWSRAAGCALKGACFNGGRKRMKRRSAVCFFLQE